MVAKVPRQARSFACTRQFHSLIVSSSRRRNEKKIKKKWICLSVNRFECRATSHRRMWTPERTTNQHLIRTWIIFIVWPHLHHICTSVEHICEWLLAFRMNCASARHSGRGSDFATKRNSNYILLLFRARPLQISGGLHRMCCCRYLLLIYLYIYIFSHRNQVKSTIVFYETIRIARPSILGSHSHGHRKQKIIQKTRTDFVFVISIAAVDVNLYIDCRLVIGSRHYSCTEKCMGSGDRPRVLESRKLSGSFNLLKIAIHFFGDSASELAQFPTSAYNPSPPRSAYFRINGHSCKQRRSTEFFRRSFFFSIRNRLTLQNVSL